MALAAVALHPECCSRGMPLAGRSRCRRFPRVAAPTVLQGPLPRPSATGLDKPTNTALHHSLNAPAPTAPFELVSG